MLFCHWAIVMLEDNTTRQDILLLLKKKGEATVEELRSGLRITPMGVRQHLLVLERRGLVTRDMVRQGVGRPAFIYKLTQIADKYFPDHYNTFTIEILEGIEEKGGRKKIDELFRWRKNKLFGLNKHLFDGEKALSEKVHAMVDMLQDKGYLVDLDETEDSFLVRQYNCPISTVSKKYPEACKYELALYRDFLGSDVKRTQCLSQGGQACEYVVLKK